MRPRGTKRARSPKLPGRDFALQREHEYRGPINLTQVKYHDDALGDSISIVDAALHKVAQMDLGAIENDWLHGFQS